MKNVIITIFLMLIAPATCARCAELLVPSQYPTIQSAINDCNDGDTVIVAPGTYTGPGNRDIDFHGKAITVRSADPNEPNVVAATIVDCQGTSSSPHRGFYFHNGEDANSILDGFTITNGYASHGGGIRCDRSSPTIKNCLITGNSAQYSGGGISGGWSSPDIINCTISNNIGSGIQGDRGNPEIANCIISGNQGGGIKWDGDCSTTIINCIISNNSGIGISSSYTDNTKIINCTINNNSSSGIYCRDSNATITGCTINNNITTGNGGGIYCYESNPTITNCIISGNAAEQGGGGGIFGCGGPISNCNINGNSTTGIHGSGGGLNNCSGPIINCTITGNSSENYGGGLNACRGPITNCTISYNSAGDGGGLYSCIGPITNCTIVGNSAGNDGGGIYGSGDISNSSIIGNSAFRNAGGIFSGGGKKNITNCTISSNSAEYYGGGLYVSGWVGYIYLTNCIFWSNTDSQGQGLSSSQIFYGLTAELFVETNYCCVQGGRFGIGNIKTDPCFIEPGFWVDANDPNIIVEPNDPNAVWLDGDYHLLPTSPCINAGDPNFIPEPNETDLNGLPRIIGGRVDMGAYEFNHQPVAVAGPNQTVFAWINGFADVNIDGSASYDDDNDVLDYYWSWTINGNTYEANDISPKIKLPIGKHTIELVVDDGIDLSQPSYCTITVIKAVRGKLLLNPQIIQTKSSGKWIIATLFILPVPGEQINKEQPLRLYPLGIEAQYQRFYRYGFSRCAPTFAIAFFDKQQVVDALGLGTTKISVVGEFQSGRFFFGSDTLKIISPKPPNHWRW